MPAWGNAPKTRLKQLRAMPDWPRCYLPHHPTGIMKTPLPLCLAWLLSVACMRADPGWAPWPIHWQSAQLLENKDFKGLEALAASLKAKGYDIRQDNPELGAFYGGLKLVDKDSEQAWQNRLQVLEQWSAAFPKSLSARIALANWRLGYAWKARGGGWAYTVTPQGAAIVDASSAAAAQVLGAVPAGTVIDDPVYYDDWIEVCLLEGRSKEEMFGYFNKGIAIAKEYEALYLSAANYLTERWYGEHGEREAWMKTWADGFPGEKGDILYAFMLSSDARYLGESVFKLPVDYNRAKGGLQNRIAEDDPAWVHDENVLCYLAVVKDDGGLARKLLLDLEGIADYAFYSSGTKDGSDYYRYLRQHYGVEKAFNRERGLERAGKLSDAEQRLNSFTSHPAAYEPLASFYERHGMRDKLLAMDYKVANKTLKEMAAMDTSSAAPEYLCELASYYPMMGDWDKAEAAARRFDQLRPMNLIGKNILLLCAIQRHDSAAQQAALEEISTFKTDRPIYLAAQSILGGAGPQASPQNSGIFKESNPYLSQGITAIALYYMARGQDDQARAAIEQSLPYCTENSGKTLLESLLFGSLSYMLKSPPAPATPDAPAPSAVPPASP